MKFTYLKTSLLLLPLALAACAGGPDRGPCPYADGRPPMPMHGPMMMRPTGDADVDFVRGMIPHHQMAVVESEKYLEHGQDPEIRQLAMHIEKSQAREISLMQDWLDKRGMAVDDGNDVPVRPMMHRHHHGMKDGMPKPAHDVRDPRAAAAPDELPAQD